MNERMAFKTEKILDLEFKFKEDGADVIRFAEDLEALVKAFITSRPCVDSAASLPDLPQT
jgi:hypothetical protein